MRNQVFKKLFSVLLALIMVAGLLPASVLAEGEGNADSTPAPTEAVQPTESAEPTTPTETETPEVTEVPEPTPENPAATVEPTQGEPTAEPTDEGIMPANVMPVQANVAARDISKDGFIRIFHLDCGRKYFSVSEIEAIIDELAKNHYTHIELAFGNDGLRFLLDDMSVTVGDTTYKSNDVTVAIKQGNTSYAHSGELTERNMNDIIAYAKKKGIGVIPMMDVPGHTNALIDAMNIIGVSGVVANSTGKNSADVEMRAFKVGDNDATKFAKALVKKYVDYFADRESIFFNVGADECGYGENYDYTSLASMLNELGNYIAGKNMTPMMFNDGFRSGSSLYNDIDSKFHICYWTYNGYTTPNELAKKFGIINTHNKWYYVAGNEGTGWFGYQWATGNMNGTYKDCTVVDNEKGKEYKTGTGCMLAFWCDNPGATVSTSNLYNYIATLATNNPTYFKAEEVKVPAVEISENQTNVKTTKETVDGKTVYKAAVKADGTSKIQLKVVNIDNTVNWASDNKDIATVDENGIVTFTGVAGTVTITATPVAATRSINETAAYSITFNVTKEGEVPQIEKDITVVEGGTATDKQDGNVTNISEYDTSIVTISTEVNEVPGSTGEPTKVTNLVSGNKYIISDGKGNYLKRNGTSLTNVSSPDDATEWIVTYGTSASSTAWLISDGGYYLSYYSTGWGLYVRTDTSKYVSWAYNDNGFKYYDGNNYLKYRNSSWTVTSNNGGSYGAAYEKGEATPGGEQTTITFYGVAKGTTSATIGHVKYTIEVAKEDVTNVAALPVQLWITNYAIEASNKTSDNYWAASWGQSTNNGNAFYENISAKVAYGEEGVSIKELMPENKLGEAKVIGAYENGGTYHKAKIEDKEEKQLVVWSGRVHNNEEGNIQKLYGTDYSNAGTEFEYIRYYNTQWAVSNDRVTWTPVKGTNSITDEQIVVYYMIRSEITAEITTDVADWGSQQGEAAYTTQVSSNNQGKFVLLDFRVKYYDGVVRPENFAVANKTFAFHCTPNDSGGAVHQKNGYYYRDLNNFRAVNTSNYEVYMVTVTMTSDAPSDMLNATQANTVNGGYTYNGEEQVLWAIDDETFAKSGLDKYTSISGSSVYSVNEFGDEPYIRGVEVYSKHGALITYYVREKEAPDFLTVNYYVQGETTPFYTYTISVKPNTVFSQDFKRVSATELTGNTVENVIGVTQTVQWDLKQMPQIGAQYRYTDYKFVDANRESDGKTVNLYYTFNATKTFVVDFGLPLRIEPKDLNENLADNGVSITETKLTGVSNFAYVSADTNGVITYKLKEMISQSDTFGVQYTCTLTTNTGLQDGTTAKYTVTIIPATNVYYEDSFAKFTDGSGAAAGATWAPVYDTNITAEDNPYANANQALETLGQADHNPYGYDSAYNNCTMFSMGSARKVNVTSDMATTGVVWPTAQFTFKGTGFDIISLTDNTSGAIFVDVYKGKEATGNRFKSYMVDNYYGYKYENGAWVVDKNASNALYQIPVMRMRDLGYGEYTAVVTVFYDRAFDHADRKSYNFWLDAVRVYDPMGESVNTGNTYGQDGEAYPQYIKLRSELKELNKGETASSGALFIDGKENANISEYANYGPNNEVYLAKGQAITFKLVDENLSKIATVQIGAKAPNGTANLVVNNGEAKVLGTATEMYYDITTAAVNNGAQLVTVTNTGAAILSLTNLKITFTEGNHTVSLDKVSAELQTQAVQMVRALFAPAPVEPEPEPEPEKTFEPEQFEASWSRNVMQGRKATLTVKTSEDVEAITVDGQTIRSYRTRTERVGFGRRAKRITYREFTYSMVAQESADFSVTAINAEGTESEAITARLTVKTRPNSMRDMWDWFKGWF